MSRQKGLSLIETVVAVLILSVGALAAATMQLTSTKANQSANNRQIATNLARGSFSRPRKRGATRTRISPRPGYSRIRRTP